MSTGGEGGDALQGALLEVRDLLVGVELPGGTATVLDRVSLELRSGERVGLVGESGSGKTMLGLSLLQLLPPGVTILGGSIRFGGQELVGLPERELTALRGRRLAMVFQDPMSGLDPLRRVGSLLADAARRGGLNRRQARERALECLRLAGIPAPGERMRSYPHQLSGGLRQRAMIGLALVNSPDVLVADEPTTALDATIQAQVLDLLRQVSVGRAVVLVTHDLGVAAEVCDRIVVLYAGQLMEEGPAGEILYDPRHPYTEGLIACRPVLGAGDALPTGSGGVEPDRAETGAADGRVAVTGRRSARLQPIAGAPPRLGQVPPGCAFAPRCSRATQRCATRPPLTEIGGRRVACWYPSGADAAGGGTVLAGTGMQR